MDSSVVPDGVSFSPERLEELEQLLLVCWAEVVAKRPNLADTEEGSSVRNLIASRLINGAASGVVDAHELRQKALFGIL
jgi:hypothetical protein